jgi:hypothetical protein
MDREGGGHLHRAEFVRGLNRMGVPLTDTEMGILWPLFCPDLHSPAASAAGAGGHHAGNAREERSAVGEGGQTSRSRAGVGPGQWCAFLDGTLGGDSWSYKLTQDQYVADCEEALLLPRTDRFQASSPPPAPPLPLASSPPPPAPGTPSSPLAPSPPAGLRLGSNTAAVPAGRHGPALAEGAAASTRAAARYGTHGHRDHDRDRNRGRRHGRRRKPKGGDERGARNKGGGGTAGGMLGARPGRPGGGPAAPLQPRFTDHFTDQTDSSKHHHDGDDPALELRQDAELAHERAAQEVRERAAARAVLYASPLKSTRRLKAHEPAGRGCRRQLGEQRAVDGHPQVLWDGGPDDGARLQTIVLAGAKAGAGAGAGADAGADAGAPQLMPPSLKPRPRRRCKARRAGAAVAAVIELKAVAAHDAIWRRRAGSGGARAEGAPLPPRAPCKWKRPHPRALRETAQAAAQERAVVYAGPQAQEERAVVAQTRQAAELGHANAQFNLGLYYYTGEGVHKDMETAVGWWRKAADQGLVQAQFNLGRCWLSGEGVPSDTGQAMGWWRKAAKQGHAGAQQAVANLGLLVDTAEEEEGESGGGGGGGGGGHGGGKKGKYGKA